MYDVDELRRIRKFNSVLTVRRIMELLSDGVLKNIYRDRTPSAYL